MENVKLYYTFDIQITKILVEQICFEQVMMLNIFNRDMLYKQKY